MPLGDRTGPMGQGPTTGRALGFCAGYDSPGYTKGVGMNKDRGFGFGRGMRFGRRRRGVLGRHLGWFYPESEQFYPWNQAMSKENEISMLKSQAEALSRSQAALEKRIQELENQKE